jgi:hypothetical protein
MEERSDGLHEKQEHGRRYDRRCKTLAFGSGWTALGCIDPNKKKIAWKKATVADNTLAFEDTRSNFKLRSR